MRVNLLVIDRDDAFLPKGWVCGALPENEAFSEYEKTSGLWKVVQGTELPCTEIRPVSLWEVQGQIKDVSELVEEDLPLAKWIQPPGTKPFDHVTKAGLDKSHSTIWDYGPGRTYSTPSSAFAALVTQVGGNVFTETHYVRGWAGDYYAGVPGGPYDPQVLLIHTVRPTYEHRLVLDRNGNDQVVFDGLDQEACIRHQLMYNDIVDYVIIDGLTLRNADAGIVIAQWNTTLEWRIKNIHISDIDFGCTLNLAVNPKIENCFIKARDDKYGLGFDDSISCNNAHPTYIIGNVIKASGTGVPILLTGASCRARLHLIGNTLYAGQACILLSSDATNLRLDLIHNNVFYGGTASFKVEQNDPLLYLEHVSSDYNCFYAQSYIYQWNSGYKQTLSDWQAMIRDDMHSIQADPLFVDPQNDDLNLQATSPCRRAGACADSHGFEGNHRGQPYLDMGAYNPSLHSYQAQPRTGHYINRRID